MNFSETIKKARQEMGISLQELSKRTGITKQQLSNYETGKCQATLQKAGDVCRALGVTFTIG